MAKTQHVRYENKYSADNISSFLFRLVRGGEEQLVNTSAPREGQCSPDSAEINISCSTAHADAFVSLPALRAPAACCG